MEALESQHSELHHANQSAQMESRRKSRLHQQNHALYCMESVMKRRKELDS